MKSVDFTSENQFSFGMRNKNETVDACIIVIPIVNIVINNWLRHRMQNLNEVLGEDCLNIGIEFAIWCRVAPDRLALRGLKLPVSNIQV